MSFSVNIEPAATEHLKSIMYYYDARRKGLGDLFYTRFDMCLDSLEKNPFKHKRYKDVRCFKIYKFPYLIHFDVIEKHNLIRVLAIISTHQNPETTYL